MKKILALVLLVTIFLTMNAWAGIQSEWNDLRDIHATIGINVKVGNEYYPIVFYLDGTATSDDEGKKHLDSDLNIGTPQADPFDLDTIAGQKAFYQALPAFLKPTFKSLRLRADGEDISQ